MLSVGGEKKTELEREQFRQSGACGAHESRFQDAEAETRQSSHAIQSPVQFYEKVHRTFQVPTFFDYR